MTWALTVWRFPAGSMVSQNRRFILCKMNAYAQRRIGKPAAVITSLIFNIVILHTAPAGPEPLVEIVTAKSASKQESAEPTWNGDTGVNFVTGYIAFGILQENQGLIAEPYVDLYHTLFQSDGGISKVTLGLQLWSSIHSEETLAKPDSNFAAWYEFDYYIP